jgi:hypothetical protein
MDISLVLAAVTAVVSLASFIRAFLTALAQFRLVRARRAQTRSNAEMAQLEERVRRAETLGTQSRKPAPAKGSGVRARKHTWGWHRVEAWGQNHPVALSLTVGCFFLLVTILLTSSSTAENHGPTAAISSPAESASVPYQVRVAGTSDDVPLDSRPWLFVQANNGFLYPQGGGHGNNVEIDRADGSWCGYAYFGERSRVSAGKEYALLLALPTPGADRKLQRQMTTLPGGKVPHWHSLPRGFHRLAPARKVIRRPDFQSKAQLEATPSCR